MGQLLKKAIKFAYEKHGKQERKYDGLPYITHPVDVMNILKVATDDEEILAAAVLHDVMEDCNVPFEEMVKEFGGRVATIVRMLTKPDNKGLAKSKEALMIKCADVIHNISDAPNWYVQKKVKDIWA